MYPKNRIDALTDGIFAVAMTLLVFNIKIADEARITDEATLIAALNSLSSNIFPYLLSFYILGMSWLSLIKTKTSSTMLSRGYAKWWLLYLLLTTCLPFSTLLIGRFPNYTVSDAIYALNIGGMALAGLRLMSQLNDPIIDDHWRDRRISLWFLVASSALTIGLSFVLPGRALLVMALNFLPSLLMRGWKKNTNRI